MSLEAKAIAETGLEQVLVLTGESKSCSPPSYIQAAVEKLVPIFSSVSVEVYSLRWRNIKRLVTVGADGMTMFQETYNSTLYAQLHPFGPKSDFAKRD